MKNKVTSILLSVIIAFGLWLYVINSVSPGSTDTIYNIPIVWEGESLLTDRNLMITSVSANTIMLELSGNRTDLNKVDASNITVKMNLSGINEPGTQIPLTYTITYPGDVPSNAFVEERKSPDTIYVTVEARREKEVPVEIIWNGTTPEGFVSDRENYTLDYPTINVKGPASVADLIEKAVIEVDLNDRKESISESYRYTLCDAEGNPVDAEKITTNVAEVRLDVKIQRVKQLELKLDVTYGGGATPKNTEIKIDPAVIRVSGGEAVLEQLGDEYLLGQLNLGMLDQSRDDLQYTITLPEGVTNETGITEATVSVTFNGLSTREFVIDEINVLNVPEGMEADLITEKLTVVLRGPTGDIAKLSEENITVTVDFADAVVGTNYYKAVIDCGEGFQSIGAMGTYSISATVQEK